MANSPPDKYSWNRAAREVDWWAKRKGLHYCKVIIEHEMSSFRPGVYCHTKTNRNTLLLWSHSEKIWFEDTGKGEVYILKDRSCAPSEHPINDNEELRKEFMWVKLQAQDI